jgi:uncharacterized protein YecE (DUF72 family)
MYYVGTSGWNYPNWQELFYPKGLKSTEWLNHYAQYFNSVEVNNSFYALPKKENLKRWVRLTPRDFIFSVKVWNVITHKRRLVNCQENLSLFLENISILKDQMGAILFQMPPNFKMDLELLKSFIKILPKGWRYTFEFRNPEWHSEEVYEILHINNIAFCIFEMSDIISPRQVTADFIYMRLHGREGKYRGNYSNEYLNDLTAWLKEQNKPSYIYFDNTDNQDDAIKNAVKLNGLLKVDNDYFL